jgi:acetylornithine/N-succinyldiaminopimelate aminotransferase
VMESCDVPALARSAGSRLVEALLRAPGVVSLRGRGLLLGVVLAPGLSARAVTALALERGLVVNAPDDAVIRLAPSLLISEAEVDEAVEILSGALAALAGG